jgi:signal transduction histidine kinase
MVRSKVRAFLGNTPVKLVAVVLFAILMPSVLVTALGLVAVFQAEAFVQDSFRTALRAQLDTLAGTLQQRWSQRLEFYQQHLEDADDRLAYLADFRQRDPWVREVLVSTERGLEEVPGRAPRELRLAGHSPILARLEEMEFRLGAHDDALEETRRRLTEVEEDAVRVELLLTAARLSYRLGDSEGAGRYLEDALRQYGDTVDVTGVVRGEAILERLVELYDETGDRDMRQESVRRLRQARERRGAYSSSSGVQGAESLAATLTAGSPARRPAATRPSMSPAQLAVLQGLLPGPRSKRVPLRLRDLGPAVVEGDVVSFTTASGKAVVHLFFERQQLVEEARRLALALDLDLVAEEISLRREKRRRAESEPTVNALERREESFLQALGPPLEHLQVRYVPPRGQQPPRFKGFDIVNLATFTWAVFVLVLTIIVGVLFTLYTVFHERRTARLKTDFVSFISHELKTPLTAIRMYTETLLDGRVDDEDEKGFCLRMVDRESQRLSNLIDQILQYSQFERHQKEFLFTSCNILDVVHEAVRLFKEQKQWGEREVEVNAVQQISKTKMDRAAMIELLLNFITNAAKYSAETEKISVNVSESIDDISVEVVDRGVGIRKRDQRKIFDKFYRADDYLTRDVEGTGLGLTFARYIAKVHNGEIKVSSQLNGGSTFTLQLRKTHVLAE